MPAVQTSYAKTMSEGVAGTAASTHGWDTDSKQVETVAGIGFGLAVSQGTAWNQVLLGGATGFVGISLRDISLQHAVADLDKYVQKETAPVAVAGDVWVVVEDDVALGDPVEYSATTGQLGSDGGVRIPNARWVKPAAAGGLAIVRLVTASAVDLDVS